MARSFLAEFLQGTAEASNNWPEVLQRQQALKAQDKAAQERTRVREEAAIKLQEHRERQFAMQRYNQRYTMLTAKKEDYDGMIQTLQESGPMTEEKMSTIEKLRKGSLWVSQQISAASKKQDAAMGWVSPSIEFGTSKANPTLASDLMGVATPDLADKPLSPDMPAYQGMATAPEGAQVGEVITAIPPSGTSIVGPIDIAAEYDSALARGMQQNLFSGILKDVTDRMDNAITKDYGDIHHHLKQTMQIYGRYLAPEDYKNLHVYLQENYKNMILDEEKLYSVFRMANEVAKSTDPEEAAEAWALYSIPMQDRLPSGYQRKIYENLLMRQNKYYNKQLTATMKNDIADAEVERRGAHGVINALKTGVLDEHMGRLDAVRTEIFEYLNNPENILWYGGGLSPEAERGLAKLRLNTEFMGRSLTGAAIQPFEREVFKALFGSIDMKPQTVINNLEAFMEVRAGEIEAILKINRETLRGSTGAINYNMPRIKTGSYNPSNYENPGVRDGLPTDATGANILGLGNRSELRPPSGLSATQQTPIDPATFKGPQ